MMRVFQFNRFLSVVICVIALGIPALAVAQVSSTEQAVMDKILKLKGEIDLLMMKPGSSADKAAMDKMMDMKRDIDTFLGLLPPHLQAQVQKKMVQSAGQASGGQGSGGFQGGASGAADLPFVMTPEEVQKVEMVLMRAQLNSLKRIAGALRQGGAMDARTQGLWVQFIESVAGSGMAADVPSLAKYVMKEAYAEENAGLESLGTMVRFHRDMRAKLREEIEKTKKIVSGVSGDDGPLPEAIRKKQFGLGLSGGVTEQVGGEVADKAGAMQYIETLETQLAKTNEDAEKANLEQEKTLLKQQPKLKAMSEVSQKLQDVGKAAAQEGQ
jgi:hypothetical protein